MPVMDGYESSSKIKSFDPDGRILVMTGNPDDSRARRTIEEGIALTLLEKPVRLRGLNCTIRGNLIATADRKATFLSHTFNYDFYCGNSGTAQCR
ncbi:MAG: hypothetical protein JRI43_05885 [Deltaproteobacteria bacterium]|nr:hypothetical protein [Deltaproteobacteria bacterium]